MDITDRNILITSAGKRVALVRAFKETLSRFFPGAKIYTTDMNPEMAPACHVSDESIKVPRVTDPEYIGCLTHICDDKSIGLIIPTIDTELQILSSHKNTLAEIGTAAIVSDSEFISTCRDKRNTVAFFKSHGIDIPAPIDPRHPTFPIFAKPYDGSLSSGIRLIQTPEEFTEDIAENEKLMFMEYIDPESYSEYTVDMYYGRDNRLKMAVPRKRIEIRAGEINKGKTEKPVLEKFIKTHLPVISGCTGCICMQLFYNKTSGDIKAIEINPRFGGGYPLSYAARANYPEFIIKEWFLNEPIEYSDNWEDGLTMLRFDDAIYF